jgi:hypothetical protein
VPGCNKSFTQLAALHQHTSAAHPNGGPSQPVSPQTSNPFKCNQCDRSYKSPDALAQHKGDGHHTRTEIKPAFKCGVPGCGRAFKTHDELTQHGLALHPKQRSSAPAAVPIHHPASTPSPIRPPPAVPWHPSNSIFDNGGQGHHNTVPYSSPDYGQQILNNPLRFGLLRLEPCLASRFSFAPESK